jgi:hypothetical protein
VLWNGNKYGQKKIMGIARQPFSVKILIEQKQLENLEYFKYLGTMIESDSRYRRKIKPRIAMGKAAFNKLKFLFTNKLDFNLKKELFKSYIPIRALESAETLTLWKVYPQFLESFE